VAEELKPRGFKEGKVALGLASRNLDDGDGPRRKTLSITLLAGDVEYAKMKISVK